jgi:hypothetical protein
VDFLGPVPVEYSVVPLPGTRVSVTYIDGSTQRAYPFALQFSGITAADAARLAAEEWAEAFAAWLDSQTKAGTLPTLGTGQTSESIEAVTWGYLNEQGQSDTAIYLISCQLIYEQEY